MKETESRAVQLGQYIAEHGATVRAAAKEFGISKSTVHKDVSERLEKENLVLFEQVKQILEKHKEERHINGGQATKMKYEKVRKQKAQHKK